MYRIRRCRAGSSHSPGGAQQSDNIGTCPRSLVWTGPNGRLRMLIKRRKKNRKRWQPKSKPEHAKTIARSSTSSCFLIALIQREINTPYSLHVKAGLSPAPRSRY